MNLNELCIEWLETIRIVRKNLNDAERQIIKTKRSDLKLRATFSKKVKLYSQTRTFLYSLGGYFKLGEHINNQSYFGPYVGKITELYDVKSNELKKFLNDVIFDSEFKKQIKKFFKNFTNNVNKKVQLQTPEDQQILEGLVLQADERRGQSFAGDSPVRPVNPNGDNKHNLDNSTQQLVLQEPISKFPSAPLPPPPADREEVKRKLEFVKPSPAAFHPGAAAISPPPVAPNLEEQKRVREIELQKLRKDFHIQFQAFAALLDKYATKVDVKALEKRFSNELAALYERMTKEQAKVATGINDFQNVLNKRVEELILKMSQEVLRQLEGNLRGEFDGKLAAQYQELYAKMQSSVEGSFALLWKTEKSKLAIDLSQRDEQLRKMVDQKVAEELKRKFEEMSRANEQKIALEYNKRFEQRWDEEQTRIQIMFQRLGGDKKGEMEEAIRQAEQRLFDQLSGQTQTEIAQQVRAAKDRLSEELVTGKKELYAALHQELSAEFEKREEVASATLLQRIEQENRNLFATQWESEKGRLNAEFKSLLEQTRVNVKLAAQEATTARNAAIQSKEFAHHSELFAERSEAAAARSELSAHSAVESAQAVSHSAADALKSAYDAKTAADQARQTADVLAKIKATPGPKGADGRDGEDAKLEMEHIDLLAKKAEEIAKIQIQDMQVKGQLKGDQGPQGQEGQKGKDGVGLSDQDRREIDAIPEKLRIIEDAFTKKMLEAQQQQQQWQQQVEAEVQLKLTRQEEMVEYQLKVQLNQNQVIDQLRADNKALKDQLDQQQIQMKALNDRLTQLANLPATMQAVVLELRQLDAAQQVLALQVAVPAAPVPAPPVAAPAAPVAAPAPAAPVPDPAILALQQQQQAFQQQVLAQQQAQQQQALFIQQQQLAAQQAQAAIDKKVADDLVKLNQRRKPSTNI